MNPKVAIIISNYNYGAYVLEAINSALKQTYNNIQIYVFTKYKCVFRTDNLYIRNI